MNRRWSLAAAAVAVLALVGVAWIAAALPTPATFEVRNHTDMAARVSLRFSRTTASEPILLAEWNFTLAPHGNAGYSADLLVGDTYPVAALARFSPPDAGPTSTTLATGGTSGLVRGDACRFGTLALLLPLTEAPQAASIRCSIGS